MARIEKTVFISYRRTDVYTALAVYENLKNQGYDIFFDYRSIASGDFERIISSNIKARAHFLLILTPTALDRCNEPGDWLRREIELAIDENRNIVPLFFNGFRFGTPSVTEKLTGKLSNLSRYNGLNVHEDYFPEAMNRLCTEYLNKPLNAILLPISTEVQKAVREAQVAADQALQDENVKNLVKQAKEKPKRSARMFQKKDGATLFEFKTKTETKSGVEQKTSISRINPRLVAGIAIVLLLTILCVWSVISLRNNLYINVPHLTQTSQALSTRTWQLDTTTIPSSVLMSQPKSTDTPSLTQTSIASTPTLGIGSTMISHKDGMTLLYVPAGEFTMGSNDGSTDERPVHIVTLDAFWIDKTEVTNSMYTECVKDGKCNPPALTESLTRSYYYGNPQFDNYPVIYVDWNMAKTYCEWAERRLPTEAEWEKAARGTEGSVYPWGNSQPKDNLLNYNGAIGDTTEVGKYPNGKSIYGALDMAGNVREWVADWYDENYYATLGNNARNPQGPPSGQYRVLRGGAYYLYDNIVRSANRNQNNPSYTSYVVGFRCAMSATP